MRQQDTYRHSLWTRSVSTRTIYGKVACASHPTVVLVLLCSSLWSVVVPSSEGTNCALEPFQEDPYVARYLSSLIQLLNWWGVGFFVHSFSCCIKNVVLLLAMLLGAYAINARFTRALLKQDPGRIPKECFDGLVLFVIAVCVVEGVVLLLVSYEQVCYSKTRHVEQQHDGPETEKTPLTM